MQLLRIKLENWRGVEAAEIQLDAGITIVEGDNEAGKSSFIEALNLLFRERDSTKKQDLKRVTPKGVDTGSKVEVEFTTGVYHLTYSKTFNKKTATTLFVHQPQSTQLVGADAHERVLQILDETIDFSLWQAIQLEQGGEFSQVSFKNSDSLAQALDNAAGGSGAGDGESVLLAKAKTEYLKYYTERAGKETGELAALREQEKTLDQSGSDLARILAELDAYVDHSARVAGELVTLADRLPSMQLKVTALEKQRAEFATLQQKLNASEASAKSCEFRLKDVERQIVERRDLVKETSALKETIAANDTARDELQQLHVKAVEMFESTTRERDACLSARQLAERQLRLIDAAVELRDRTLNLQQLELQHQQLQSSHKELSDLETELNLNRVDDVMINRIEKLEQQRRDQEMQVSAHSAKISFEFLKETFVDDGENQRLYNVGEDFSASSSKAASLKFDDSLKVQITPAADHYELTLDYQKTVESLNELLSGCGVSSPVEATAVHRKRAELVARLREMKRGYKTLSKEQTLDELSRSIEIHRQAIAGLQGKTGKVSDNLEADRQTQWQQLTELEQRTIKARDLRDQAQQHCAESKAKLDVCVESNAVNGRLLQKLQLKSDALEASVSFSQLELQQLDVTAELNELQNACESARAELQNSNSSGVEMLVDNARQSLQRAQGELRDFELQQADVKARLDQMQAEGLHEKHQSVLAEHNDNVARLKQLNRRARAAAKLWKTLCHHQREAQLSYARPLAERVVSMGKVIFGDDFSVELSETLNIVSRTLNGTTVPFDDLSGGAREQLGILLRLAAAQLVSKSEAMPLILDDTLGHTDAKRLETMGAILNSAAQTAQIVVMTCYPARYSYVGSATVVRLRQQQGSLFEAL